MKLSEAFDLFITLRQIAQTSQTSPKDFPVLVKLALAENMRLSLPHAQEFETERNDLMKQRGESAAKDEPLDSPASRAFTEEMKKLADAEVNTKFRLIRESDLKEAPLTIDQISILQQCGILIPNEVPKPPVVEPPK